MARIVEERRICVGGETGELLQAEIERALVGVDREDHLEAEPAQDAGDVGGIILGIDEQVARVFVVRVADHQRDAPVGMRRIGRQREKHRGAADDERGENRPRSIPPPDAIRRPTGGPTIHSRGS